jgi:hypothetical protein
MRQHDHYCGWKIEWEVSESGGVSFWIESEYQRVRPRTVLIDRHHVAIFKTEEEGYQKTKELIDLLYNETRLLKEITVRNFKQRIGGYGMFFEEPTRIPNNIEQDPLQA